MTGDLLEPPGWKIPFFLAVALHAGALVLATFSPSFLHRQPLFPDIQTVELVNIQDLCPTPTPPPTAPPPVASAPIVKPSPTPAPAMPSPKAPIAAVKPAAKQPLKKLEGPQPSSSSPASDAISFNPVKQREAALKKIEERVAERLQNEHLLRSKIEEIKAIQKQQAAEQKSREAAKAAVSKLKDFYQESKPRPDRPAAAAPGSFGPGAQPLDDKQVSYWTSALIHIQKFWTLPDLQNWDKNLEAVYVIKVRRDGGISKKYFERRSESLYFNAFVEKAVKDADPLPAFPASFKENDMEIGLIFHPAGLL